MSAVQRSGVHEGMLHADLRHYLPAASAVRQLPAAVRTASQVIDVRSLSLLCGLELATCQYLTLFVIRRLFDSFRIDQKSYLQHIRGCATMRYVTFDIDIKCGKV